jgi:4'-phosphopantetheinyl transferase
MDRSGLICGTGDSRKCSPGRVDVWRIQLDVSAIRLQMLEATLSHEERVKANGFQTAQLRSRWTAARGALRYILSVYAGTQPSSLVFRVGRFGKPYLRRPGTDIGFNFSHTGGVAFLAVTAESRVGVDAEIVHPIADLEGISRRFFAAPEADEILCLTPEARLSAFFACWTRKEAFVKALGNGLQMDLDRFRVNVRADEPPRLISMDWHDSSTWSLADLGEPGIAATLAVDGPPPEILRFDFELES